MKSLLESRSSLRPLGWGGYKGGVPGLQRKHGVTLQRADRTCTFLKKSQRSGRHVGDVRESGVVALACRMLFACRRPPTRRINRREERVAFGPGVHMSYL